MLPVAPNAASVFFHRAENWLWKLVNLRFIKEFSQPERGKHDSKRIRNPNEFQ
jgi:hypothetical protein